MQNKENVILSIGQNEFDSTYKADQRLHVKAYERTLELLEKSLYNADLYNTHQQENKNRAAPSHKTRAHNAIFISGERGVGKTSFLLNIRAFLADQEKEKNYQFFGPIDPTLVEDNDNFLNSVVAEIHRQIEEDGSPCIDDYWRALEELAECIEDTDRLRSNNRRDELFGADRIALHRGGLGLESAIETYFEKILAMKGKKIIVLLIDDIDMSLQHAWSCLEVIRRYLPSPLVVPIVSGDGVLYRSIVEQKFIKDTNAKEGSESLNQAQDLADQYLRKVFPADRRVKLYSLPDLIRFDMNMFIKPTESENEIPIITFYRYLQEIMMRGVNGIENSKPSINRKTARQLNQFLLSLPENTIKPLSDTKKSNFTQVDLYKAVQSFFPSESEQITNLSLEKFSNILRALRQYWTAENEFDHAYRTEGDLELIDILFGIDRSQEKASLALRDIPIFNPKLHPKEHSKYRNPYKKEIGPEISVVPFPPYDSSVRGIGFSKKYPSNKPFTRFLISFLAHDDYFTPTDTSHLVYLGKVYELVVTSLLGATDENSIVKVMQNRPYHSELMYRPTKFPKNYDNAEITDGDLEEDDQPEDEDTKLGELKGIEEFVKDLSVALKQWRSNHKSIIQSKLSAQLLSLSINHAFTQFEVLKNNNKKRYSIIGDSPIALLQRMRLIIANSFAYFEFDETSPERRISNKNTAMTMKLRKIIEIKDNDDIFDFTTSRNSDNVFSINIKPLIEGNTLTNAVWNHPIFTLKCFDYNFDDETRIGDQKPKKNSMTSTQRRPSAATFIGNALKGVYLPVFFEDHTKAEALEQLQEWFEISRAQRPYEDWRETFANPRGQTLETLCQLAEKYKLSEEIINILNKVARN